MASEIKKPELSTSEQLKKAANKALGGGLAGAAAMVVQVTTLMWMRTTMNYQYKYGTGMTTALKTYTPAVAYFASTAAAYLPCFKRQQPALGMQLPTSAA